MLTSQHCKESLSRAYITAVVGRSLNNLAFTREYDYGVDGTVREINKRGLRRTETGWGFDFQTKSSVDWSCEDGFIVYDLEADTFNDLAERRGNGTFPIILILLCLPKEEEYWLVTSIEAMILCHCAFWFQITDSITTNQETKRIRIPLANQFSPQAVSMLIEMVKKGEMLP